MNIKNAVFTGIFVCLSSLFLHAQTLWTWEALPPMPEAVANNAVTAATVGGVPYVYSFSGINQTKIWSGIHLDAHRFNTQTQTWETIAPLPDDTGQGGKIAAGASTVKNKIYIMGGYHVFANGSEVSSEKVHIYDPETNSYLPDGAPIPVPIDDHIQAVYRDSLIFVVTGWSNSTNVADVQIYNPSTNTWSEGTPTPDNGDYKVFGGSGTIVGDTIYYAGGARIGFNFPLGSFFRKGYIHPDDPTQIDWEDMPESLALGYRMGAAQFDDKPLWFGGSMVSYNYNGIAYNGSGGVAPSGRLLIYRPESGSFLDLSATIPATMDLRGIAQVGYNQYVITGGMITGQEVTDQAWLVTNLDNVSVPTIQQPKITLYPNPASNYFSIDTHKPMQVVVYDVLGKKVLQKNVLGREQVDIENLSSGVYWVKVCEDCKLKLYQKLVVNRGL